MEDGEATSVRFSAGDFSFECCGTQEFVQNHALKLFSDLWEVTQGEAAAPTARSVETRSLASDLHHMSTNTVASHLGASSGSELVISAVAHIQLVKGQDKATRKQIAEEMKSATTFYRQTYMNNLSKYLDGLVRSRRLNLVAENTFALTAAERDQLAAQLGEETK